MKHSVSEDLCTYMVMVIVAPSPFTSGLGIRRCIAIFVRHMLVVRILTQCRTISPFHLRPTAGRMRVVRHPLLKPASTLAQLSYYLALCCLTYLLALCLHKLCSLSTSYAPENHTFEQTTSSQSVRAMNAPCNLTGGPKSVDRSPA